MIAAIKSRMRSNELNMLLLDSKQPVDEPIASRVSGLKPAFFRSSRETKGGG
jgi:hypothetical protein